MDIMNLTLLAQAGNGLSCYILGRSYYCAENNAEKNYNKAYRWYKYGAEILDDPRCMYGYAKFFYDDGESDPEGVVEKNNDYANKMFAAVLPNLIELSKQNEKYATFILGEYYNYGLGGVKPDFITALKLIRKSAELGHPGACYDMGKFYMMGKGLQQDEQKAKEYFQAAKKGGCMCANYELTRLA